MNYLHYEIDAQNDEVIEVILDAAANVQLMDGDNFNLYSSGQPFHYFGGYAKTSPFRIQTPRTGHWHIVVDLGGYAGRVRAAVRVAPEAQLV